MFKHIFETLVVTVAGIFLPPVALVCCIKTI